MDLQIYLERLEQIDKRAFQITVRVTSCPAELTPEVLSELLKNLLVGIKKIVKGET